MPFPISLFEEQYASLVSLAREGVKDQDGNTLPEKSRKLEAFLKDLETKAGVERHGLWIQWQETDQPLPPATRFPETWPPELRFWLELTSRAISRADVDKVLDARARKPQNVLVTRDPAGVVGWSDVDSYFVNG